MSDLRFWVSLLLVAKPDEKAARALQDNCVHVVGPWWIMEGDTDYLRDEGVRFEEVEEGTVGALGGLSKDELITVCKESFGIDLYTSEDD